MQETKYYDYGNNRPFNLESDGCDLAQWNCLHGQARFARHPKGFKVFLPPDKLAASDEYVNSDPYTVEQNIDNAFHRRRMELTVDLLRQAISFVRGTPKILDLGCGQRHLTHAIH